LVLAVGRFVAVETATYKAWGACLAVIECDVVVGAKVE
jgi:hypothetical protein